MKKGKKAVSAVIVFLSFLSFLFSQKTFEILNKDNIVEQGGVLVIKINVQLEPKKFLIYAFNKFYKVNKDGLAFIGIDLETKPEFYTVSLTNAIVDKDAIGFTAKLFRVAEKDFPKQNAPFRIKKPSKREVQRRLAEVKIIQSVFKEEKFSKLNNDWENQFGTPLEQMISTEAFGTQRVYKKAVIGRHRGEDLKASKGTPVYSVQEGKVVLARKFSLEGNMAVISHGLGVYSIYMHLSRFETREGQTVKSRQIIGFSGETGRVSGPHLHFAVKINGANVGPLDFIETVNKFLN